MVDRFTDGFLTPTETSSYLEIPHSTLTTWLKGKAAGALWCTRWSPYAKASPPYRSSRWPKRTFCGPCAFSDYG
ncbi:hypothetical protein NKH18_20875 [Streptomyces sp. M10(2022)]